MIGKDYRRDWAQEQARRKLREMRGSGLSDVKIGARLDVTGVFVGAMLRDTDPKPVSKKVWDALIEKEGLVPAPPSDGPKAGQTETVVDQTIAHLVAMVERLTTSNDTQARLLNASYDRMAVMSERLASIESQLRQQAQILADLRKAQAG